MPAVHTEALAGHGETCRWMSAAAGASGDRVLAIVGLRINRDRKRLETLSHCLNSSVKINECHLTVLATAARLEASCSRIAAEYGSFIRVRQVAPVRIIRYCTWFLGPTRV